MADNTISAITGTPGNTSGYTVVEQYLVEQYLAERTFETPLAQSGYGSKMNLPKRKGQYCKFTRRNKLRTPEVAVEATDPESGATLSYEQINVPIEFIDDYIAISTMAADTSWLDLAKDAKELTFEAIKRYLNRATQAAFLMGRCKPGHRNSSGVTTGAASYPHFWTTPEATVTKYGVSFTFDPAPRYFTGGAKNFAELDGNKLFTMQAFRDIGVRLRNSGAPKINGKYIAVISESIKADLEKDDTYFQAAIRNQAASTKLFNGELADYAGFHWVMDDEPWCLEMKGDQWKHVDGGNVHVAQVFGQDAFGYLRLGGQDSSRPTFKVQDISKTGNLMTIGYIIPTQVAVLNRKWCANLIGPVGQPGNNG